jgi:hypothetical protein
VTLKLAASLVCYGAEVLDEHAGSNITHCGDDGAISSPESWDHITYYYYYYYYYYYLILTYILT